MNERRGFWGTLVFVKNLSQLTIGRYGVWSSLKNLSCPIEGRDCSCRLLSLRELRKLRLYATTGVSFAP